MVGLLQIIIYLFCAYLIYKGFEIFQIAFTSNPEFQKTRQMGIIIGCFAVMIAIAISFAAIFMMDDVVKSMNDNLNKINNFGK